MGCVPPPIRSKVEAAHRPLGIEARHGMVAFELLIDAVTEIITFKAPLLKKVRTRSLWSELNSI